MKLNLRLHRAGNFSYPFSFYKTNGGMKMNKEFLTYIVRSQRLAGFLMMAGFKLHAVREDEHGSRRNVFFFTNSPELLNKIEEYKKLR